MSRNCSNCGGSSDTCNCIFQSGSGIIVTGAGTTGSPYVSTLNIQHDDTDTVALVGAGTGTSLLTANVILDPDGGLEATSLGIRLKDECTEVMCSLVDGSPVGFKKTVGAGSTATITYYNTSGVSQGSSIPVGWGLCNCLSAGGGGVVTSDDDVVFVSGANAVSLNSKISRVVSTSLAPASIDPNSVGVQTLSTGSLTITNPSSDHEMNVLIMYQMHNASWSMAGVTSVLNNWSIYTPDSLQTLFQATSTDSAIENHSQGGTLFNGAVATIAGGASLTVSLTQQFIVTSTSGSVSNQALHGYGGITMIGVIK